MNLRKFFKIWIYAPALALGMAGCATSQFERQFKAGNWLEAAEEFSNDSTLLSDEKGLFRAAQLYSNPGRPTYNPALGKELFTKFIYRFPKSDKKEFASEQVALLNEVLSLRQETSRKIYDAENETRKMVINTQALLVQIDSLSKITTASQSKRDSLAALIAKLEADLKEKDEQLKGLRAELAKLKQIDLGTKNGR